MVAMLIIELKKVIHMANDTAILWALKGEGLDSIITNLIYCKLRDKAMKNNPLKPRISFREASYIIGSIYRLPKNTHFKIFRMLEKRELVNIVPYSYLEFRPVIK